jgi:aminoglycoside 3-N-acetyltransferase
MPSQIERKLRTMSEADTVAKTIEPNTIQSIIDDLRKVGIEEGDILLVHSSLSSIGWVCGGPQSVIMALLTTVGSDGTLVMPSHSGDWSDPAQWQNPPVPKEWVQTIYDSMPAFDPELSPTRGMGWIAELFRTFPGTIRSCHPQVSFSANGKHAIDITENHPLTPQFGMDSPLGKLYRQNAKILLLGVGYGNCTSFHLAETLTPGMPIKKMGTAMMENGERVWKWFEDINFNDEDFDKMGEDFEKVHTVRKGNIGNAVCRVFRIRDAVDFAQEWLPKHRL